MATINFFIQSKNNPAGIYVRVRDGRRIDAKAKTKFVVNPSDWSQSKGEPKNLKDENLKKLSLQLQVFKTQLLHHYNSSISIEDTIGTEWLKEFINPTSSPDAIPAHLVEYFDYFVKHRKNSLEKASFTKYMVIKRLMERFQKREKKSILIKDVDADFKYKFEDYCAFEGYAKNTIARAFKFIKTVCYDAHKNGVPIHFQLKFLNSKIQPVDKVYLSSEEIEKILKAELTKDYLDNARDWLIISCETGQRVSDFMKFTRDLIHYESTGHGESKKEIAYIDFRQQKTKKLISLPLSPMVMEVLQKRGGAFPRKISGQKYNEYIKEVAEKAGLTQIVKGSKQNKQTNRKESGLYPKFELITSHIGRRSFATNHFGNIPTSLLRAATGHSTEAMLLAYVGKTEKESARQLAQYLVK